VTQLIVINNRVGLKFPYDPTAKDALKAEVKAFWNPENKVWTVSPSDLTKATDILSQHGYHFDTDGFVPPKEHEAFFSAPDTVMVRFPYEVVTKNALKRNGATWEPVQKMWTFPVGVAKAMAVRVEKSMPELAQVILALPEVSSEIDAQVERASLSQATSVDADELKARIAVFGNPYPHQWVAPQMYMAGNRKRLLIADEMGLGKTLQAIMCVEAAEHERILVICPAVVRTNWSNEIEQWRPTDSKRIIRSGKDALGDEKWTIINYDLIHNKQEELQAARFQCVVVDEVHNIKNHKAKRTMAACKLMKGADGLIALSGTPITNRPSEFYTVLSTMLPSAFGNWWSFVHKYSNAYQGDYGLVVSGASNIDRSDDGTTIPLNSVLRDIMLRRSSVDPIIAEHLPELIESNLVVELNKQEQKQYDACYNEWFTQLDMHRDIGNGSTPQGFILNMMTDLRKTAGIIKARSAAEYAKQHMDSLGTPLVIFAHHKEVIHAIADALPSALPITGDTPHSHRDGFIEAFQAGDISVLVASTGTMREGINLTASDTVVFAEREWTPAIEQQATARVRRISQDAPICNRINLTAENTIDEHLNQLLAHKADVVARSLDGDLEKRAENLIVKELLNMLEKEGAALHA
tara:strand:+ start:1510 stop:3417 length:1908 start_codon:yes stop_codon:yes gene_type:complete